MAIAYSLVASNTVATTGDTVTTGSFTPTNGSLLVGIAVGFVLNTPAAPVTIADTATLTWTNRVARVDGSGGGSTFPTVVYIWTAPVVTGTSMTVTADYNHGGGSDATGRQSIYVIQVTGQHATTPFVQAITAGGGSSDDVQTHDFGAAPAATSLLFSCANVDDTQPSDGSEIVIGTGWTQVAEQSTGNPYNVSKIQTKTGTTSPAVLWNFVSADWSWSIGSVEIAEATSSPNVSVDLTGNSVTASVGDVTVTIPATSVSVNVDGLSLLALVGRVSFIINGVPISGDDGRQREGQMMEMGRWMGH